MGLVFANATVFTATGEPPLENGAVAVDGSRIGWIGPTADAPKGDVVDCTGKTILPGLVDAHTHYPQTRIIGAATGPLLEWLDTSVFPEEARFRRAAYARQVAGEMVRRMTSMGTTTAAIFSSSSARATDELFTALAASGMRAVVGLTLMDQRCPREVRVPRAEAMQALRGAILEFHQKPRMAKATLDSRAWTAAGGQATNGVATPGVVVPYAKVSRTARTRSANRNGLASQRQALSSRERSASVPATSSVTKMTRRASAGVAAAMAR